VVLTNRTTPPDVACASLARTGDQPFARIEDVISAAELAALSGNTSGSRVTRARPRSRGRSPRRGAVAAEGATAPELLDALMRTASSTSSPTPAPISRR
jgi:hypothetical protein